MKRRYVALIGVAAVLAAGAVGGYYALTARSFTFAGRVEGIDPGTKVIVSSGGVELTRSNGETAVAFAIVGTKKHLKFSQAAIPEISVTSLRACGWRPLPVAPEWVPADVYEPAVAEGKPILVRFTVDAASREKESGVALHVDNRRHGQIALAVGQAEIAFPANTIGVVKLPTDSQCEEGLQLKFDGELVETLPPPAGDPDPAFLIDTTGRRCYRTGFQSFGRDIDGRAAVAPTAGLQKRRIHALQTPPNFFLQDFPTTMRIIGLPGRPTNLMSVPCDVGVDPQEFEDTRHRFEDKGDTTALIALLTMAQKGHAPAAYVLGRAHYFGERLPQSFSDAMTWFELAEANGDDRASVPLALMYLRALGRRVDAAVAGSRLMELAEEYGAPVAPQAARLLEMGRGVRQDYEKAYFWHRVAALGDVDVTSVTDPAKDPRLSQPPEGPRRFDLERVRTQLSADQIRRVDERFREWRPRRLSSEIWAEYNPD